MNVALITRILAHYREPVFSLLVRQDEEGLPKFTFFAGKDNRLTSVETVNSDRAEIPVSQGGFRWKFIRTYSVFNCGVWQSGIINVFFSKEYDVIVLDTSIYYLSTWIGLLIAKIRKKKIAIWGHGFKKRDSGIKSWLRMRQYNMVDAMLLYGNRAKEIMLEKGYDPAKIYLVYNSLDYDKQAQLRDCVNNEYVLQKKKSLFSDSDIPVLTYIGRLSSGKKLELIIEAAAILKGKGMNCNVLFIGEGESKSSLVQLAKRYLLDDNVVMYGSSYDEEDISYLMAITDVCVVPDAVGLSCIHSMAYGVPVVTSDNFDVHGPEFEAVIPDETGSFYKNGCVDSLVEELIKWLSIKDRSAISKNCINIVEKHYTPVCQQKVINNALDKVVSA